MTFDRLSFPRLAHYLDGLPHRIASHPAVLTRADFSLILRERLGTLLTEAKLGHEVRASVLAPWKPGDWIPMTAYVALCAIARDRLWQTEETYHQGMLEVALEMYKGPLYRALFIMFGPSLVAMSAAKRWHTLHQGTELKMKKQTKESCELRLTYPEKLLSEAAVQSLGAAFCAIAQGSRGKNPTFTQLSFGDTAAEVLIRWNY